MNSREWLQRKDVSFWISPLVDGQRPGIERFAVSLQMKIREINEREM